MATQLEVGGWSRPGVLGASVGEGRPEWRSCLLLGPPWL